MARKTKNGYERLAKGPRTSGLLVATRQSLWLGQDHVLVVGNHGYTESYKRFYFAQVQGLILHQTQWGKIWTILLGIFLTGVIACLIPGLILGWHLSINWIMGILSTLFGLVLFMNLVKGPTCICTIHTAVQSQRLYALNRVRRAVPALQRLREKIECAQGPLDSTQITSAMLEQNPSPATSSSKPARKLRTGTGRRSIGTQIHTALFSLLLADCLHSALRINLQSAMLTTAGVLLGFALIILTVVGLVRQQNSALPAGLRRTTWFAAGHLGICSLFGSIYNMTIAISNPTIMGNAWNRMSATSNLAAMDSPAMMTFIVYSLVTSLLIGAIGLRALERYRRTTMTPPPLPPPT
jgi:hypothetical protein